MGFDPSYVSHMESGCHNDGHSYRLTKKRLLRNTGDEPVTRYLIRISVDRYPGDPDGRWRGAER
ncbi:hypothetical protein [Streptomyces platensis]|uniref:hypothetical protein n=1 Tax=Streptomyces platensis TaxID=58346 RepID=UPI0036B4ACA6